MLNIIIRICCIAAWWSLPGCVGGRLPQITPVQAQWAGQQWPGMELAQLGQGRRLYVNRCSGCHNLVLPAAKDLDQWKLILAKMAVKAKLNEGQRELIWRYLQTVKRAPADATISDKAGQ